MASSGLRQRIAMLSRPGPCVYIARKESFSPEVPTLFYDALAVREDVFNKEQNCNPDLEIDTADPVSWHWIIYGSSSKDESGSNGRTDRIPAATIRLIPASIHDHGHDVKHGAEVVTDEGGQGEQLATEPNYGGSDSGIWDGQESYAMIGRLATLKAYRGKGFGKVLVEQALDWARRHPMQVGSDTNWNGLLLAHAQVKVEGWYKSMGWVRDDGMGHWWEEGIEHVGMWKRVEIQNQ